MKKINIKNFDQLQAVLIKKGLNIRGFSELVGIGYANAHTIVTGKRNPSPHVANQIANALNVEFDEIFEIV